MLFHPLIAPSDKRANRRRRGVKDIYPMIFDNFPETIRLRPQLRRPARGQRPVDDVAVARHPADVRGAPEDVFVAKVKDVFS